MFFKNQSSKSLFADSSLLLLLFSNFSTIFFALKDGWSLSTIVWIYWCQSIIIGFFNFVRILKLKEFSTKGYTISGRPALPTQNTKIFTAFFFLFHYGFFHFVYFIFLLAGVFDHYLGVKAGLVDIKYVLLGALLFFANHLFSFLYNQPKDDKGQNIGVLMFYPYARIIPMHITIIGAGFIASQSILPIFLVLKTLSDALMHIVEHRLARRTNL